ncbi:helix-turn-helix domain-containing protein [Zhouia amylolytica]|uniref:Helix-turn-helix domain-containing protein n=1 Tax=Zhouia amylolytica AD3 TaxID=1286632 RepID=W2UNQ9_9FLAO|nr:helix-turn-helix domain-containing protein [Zhouia amylolytica]ETN95775.1 hypothetical protein P278_14970 [Zhouia amylolytica AD3]
MTQILLTAEDLEGFKDELINEVKMLVKEALHTSTTNWIKSAEVRKLLGISHSTLCKMRANGTLPCTKIGGIYFHDRKAIAQLLGVNISFEEA